MRNSVHRLRSSPGALFCRLSLSAQISDATERGVYQNNFLRGLVFGISGPRQGRGLPIQNPQVGDLEDSWGSGQLWGAGLGLEQDADLSLSGLQHATFRRGVAGGAIGEMPNLLDDPACAGGGKGGTGRGGSTRFGSRRRDNASAEAEFWVVDGWSSARRQAIWIQLRLLLIATGGDGSAGGTGGAMPHLRQHDHDSDPGSVWPADRSQNAAGDQAGPASGACLRSCRRARAADFAPAGRVAEYSMPPLR